MWQMPFLVPQSSQKRYENNVVLLMSHSKKMMVRGFEFHFLLIHLVSKGRNAFELVILVLKQ